MTIFGHILLNNVPSICIQATGKPKVYFFTHPEIMICIQKNHYSIDLHVYESVSLRNET